jgi:hypothetical protein
MWADFGDVSGMRCGTAVSGALQWTALVLLLLLLPLFDGVGVELCHGCCGCYFAH